MSQETLDTFVSNEYEVLIEVTEGEPELRVGCGKIEGKTNLKFVLCAHLDHPGMANDDLSGVMVLCEVKKRLENLNLEYGLEFVITLEIIGTEYFLQNQLDDLPLEGLFVNLWAFW